MTRGRVAGTSNPWLVVVIVCVAQFMVAIEFSLFREAAGSSSFHHLHVGGLDQWISPKDPTLGQRNGDVWKLDKVVSDLAGPAVYRLKATFRWTDAHHRVLLHTSRETPVCRAD